MQTIIAFSIVMWIFIDRLKALWANSEKRSIITSMVALIVGMVLAFCYKLDLLYELGLVGYTSFGGYIFGGLALMGGSSCINEILEKLNFTDLKLKGDEE